MYNEMKWQGLTDKQLYRYWNKAMSLCNIVYCQWFADLCLEMDKRKLGLRIIY